MTMGRSTTMKPSPRAWKSAPNKQAAKIRTDLFIAELVDNPGKMLPDFFERSTDGRLDAVAAVYDCRPIRGKGRNGLPEPPGKGLARGMVLKECKLPETT
jgi:hypothetical protein